MRKVFACLFALLALATAALQFFSISRHAALPLSSHLACALFAITAGITACYLFRARAAWEARLVCPACREPAQLVPCTLGQPRSSMAAFLIGGMLFTILVRNSQKHRFRCAGCSTESSRRTFGSWLALAWCLVIVMFLIASMAAE